MGPLEVLFLPMYCTCLFRKKTMLRLAFLSLFVLEDVEGKLLLVNSDVHQLRQNMKFRRLCFVLSYLFCFKRTCE